MRRLATLHTDENSAAQGRKGTACDRIAAADPRRVSFILRHADPLYRKLEGTCAALVLTFRDRDVRLRVLRILKEIEVHLGNYLLTVTLINTERRGASQLHWHKPFLQVSSSGRRPSSSFGAIGVKRLLLILAVGGLAPGLMAGRIQMSEHAGEEAPAE